MRKMPNKPFLELGWGLVSAIFLLLLVTGLASGPAWALKSDSKQPIHLEADSADIDDATKTSIFTGSVIMTQGTVRITGNYLRTMQKATKGGGDSYLAKGSPAYFKQEIEGKPGQFVEGHADSIQYFSDSEFLHLIGNAYITQEGDTVQTDQITYDRIRSLVKGGAAAKGKERVRMVIQPKKDNKP